jgi:eukaryotic-like serine/threonine-protein kinase
LEARVSSTIDIPERIGPYTIVEVIGEGGMGVVCIAHQSEPIRRTVALKILKATADSKQVLARFEAERQALAVMEHPAIAKVFDAGITEDGSPFVVMERVSGSPINEYCDERRLTIRERIELFGEVCRAVQHAHQKGIIHRDLKPNHILVSDMDGRSLPRIIDFGIAKAMGVGDFEGVHLFYGDEVVGTPAYMSPEQIQGSSDVDTRSDIYSLGIMLYELLVGALPYEADEKPGWSAIAAHLLEEPPTPTERLGALSDTQDTIANLRRTTPPALRRELKTDLDWIVSRAMDRNRERRYETAYGLARDLERYLALEPVRARKGGPVYRLSKFTRRNRLPVAFAATVVIALVTLTVTSAVQAARTARARDEAQARRSQAEALIDFMLSDLRQKLEPVGRLDVLDDVGEQALEYFSRIPDEAYSDPELMARSQALYQIGEVRLDQGRLPEAQRAFDESLRFARALSERDPSNDAWLFALGQAEFYAGEGYRRGQNLAGALVHFQAYRDVANELIRRNPASPEYLLEVGYSHTNVGAILRAEGRHEEALTEFARSLEAKESVAESDPESQRRRYDVAQSHNTLGATLQSLGRLAEARTHLEADLTIEKALVEESPDNANYVARMASSHHFLGRLLHMQGDLEGAVASFRAHQTTLRPLSETDPSNLRWRRSLAVADVWEAHVLVDKGEAEAALALAQRAATRLGQLVGLSPEQADWLGDLARAHREYSRVLIALGRPDEARSEAEVAIEVAQRRIDRLGVTAKRLAHLAEGELLLGDALLGQGRTGQAEVTYRAAVSRLDPILEGSTDVDIVLTAANGLTRLGRVEESRDLVEKLEDMGFLMPELGLLRQAWLGSGN